MNQRQQSSTGYPIHLYLVLASDHVTPATGKTVSVAISRNGGTFAAASGAVSEIGYGWYALAGNAADRSTAGELLLRATAAGCDETPGKYVIVPWDPFDAARLGLTALPAAGAAAPGDAMALTAGERTAVADALLDRASGVEAGVTLRQAHRLLMAVLAGRAAESAGTAVFRRADGSTAALTVVHDAQGNRTSVTIGDL